MKIVQTRLSDSEYKLLEEYATRNSKTIKEVVKEAIRKTVIENKDEPGDSLFVGFPSCKKIGRKDDASNNHD
ncbi:MAG: hypothetical protein ACYCQJ_06185 [Nitrososphaerales archaeon]